MFTNENNLHTIPRELLSISVFINDDLLGMKVIKLVPLYFQCNFVHENLEKKAIEKQVFGENLHTNAYDKTECRTTGHGDNWPYPKKTDHADNWP